ncbi:MAG TPA: hypothetical protein VIV55_10135 [Flavobacterium sp.]
MINEETFVDTINLLEVMVKKSKTDEHTVILLKRILKLLPLSFPNEEQAKLLIESYCFEENFGKPSPDSEYTTPGQLYKELT